MAISSRLAELNRKYGTAGGGQAEKQSAARKAGTVSARLAALQQRTAQNGSVSAKSQSADAQYLRGDRKPPAPTADAAKTLLSSGVNPVAPLAPAAQSARTVTTLPVIQTLPTVADRRAAREDAAAQKSVVRLPTAAEKKAAREDSYAQGSMLDASGNLEARKLADAKAQRRLDAAQYNLNRRSRMAPYDPETERDWAAMGERAMQEEPTTPFARLNNAAASIGQTFAAAPVVMLDTAKQYLANNEEETGNPERQAAKRRLAQVENQLQYTVNQYNPAYPALVEERDRLRAILEDTKVRTPVSQDSAGSQMMLHAMQTKEDALQGMEGAPRWLAEQGLSIGQNAALLPLGLINPALPLAAMGTIAAADKTFELNQRGVAPGEALVRGLVAGGIEAATEKIPLDNLMDLIKTGGKSALKNLLKQAGVEAGEESLSYVMNYIADKAARDPEAEFSLSELASSAGGGAFSGLVFGGFGTAANRLRQPVSTLPMVERTVQNLPGSPFESAQAMQTQQGNTDPIQKTNAAPAGAFAANKITEGDTPQPRADQGRQRGVEGEPSASAPIIADSSAKGTTQSAPNSVGQTGTIPAAERVQVQRLAATLGESGAGAFTAAYDRNASEQLGTERAFDGFVQVYNAALTGKPMNVAGAQKASALPEYMRMAAESAGKNDALRAEQAKYFGKDAGLVRDRNWKNAKLSAKTSRVLDAVGKVSGVQVRMVERITDEATGKGANARYVSGESGGVIEIALDAEDPVRTAFTHEIVHRIREVSPESYTALAEFVHTNLDALSAAGLETRYARQYGTDDMSSVTEEMVADAFGRLMGDSKTLERFALERRTAAERVMDAVRELLEKVRAALGNGRQNAQIRLDESQRSVFRDLERDLDGMARTLEAALEHTRAAAERNLERQVQKNTAQKGDGYAQHSFKGKDAQTGRSVYESNFPIGTPKSAKAARVLELIQTVWSKNPIDLVITETGNERHIQAKFDPAYDDSGNIPSDASKLMGGNRHSTSKEQRVTLDLADDYYQIASESRYNYSKAETGKSTATHNDVKTWHYFINDIMFQEYGETKLTPYRVTINVKEKTDGNFVYSFSAEQDKSQDTQRTLHAAVNQSGKPAKASVLASNHDIPQTDGGVKEKFSLKDNQGRELSKEQATFFRYSKAVDDEGRLVVVYHGTSAEFTVFDKDRSGSNYGYDETGFFFTTSREEAEEHADSASWNIGGSQRIQEAYLDIENPLEIDAEKEAFNPTGNATAYYDQHEDGITVMVQDMGHDGIIVRGRDGADLYIVFEPEQIKSVDNKNPTSDPDIRRSLKGSREMDRELRALMERADREAGWTEAEFRREVDQIARRIYGDQVEQTKASAKEKESAGRKRRSAAELRQKIVRHTKELSAKLLKPTDKQHIPENLRGPVAAMLESINLESSYELEYGKDAKYHRVEPGENRGAEVTRRTESFRALRAQYAKIVASQEWDMVIDPSLLGSSEEGVQGLFDEVISMKDTRLADMNADQLETVWNVVRAVERSVSTAGKVLSKGKYARTQEWATALQADTGSRRTKTGLTRAHALIDLETPYTFFSHYGEAGKAVYRMLRDAQDRQQVMVEHLSESVRRIAPPKTVKTLEETTHTFAVQDGVELTLSTAQIMELYELMKRKQAHDHLLKGGIVQPEIRSAKIRRGTDSIHLSEGDLAKIIGTLTDEQMKLSDGLQGLMRGILADYGNEASMSAYGYRKFTEEHYWPIKSAREGLHTTVEKGGNNPRSIKNIGMAQATKPHANNPLDIAGIFSTFASHAADMTDYAAWLCPMEDVNRLFNFQFRDGMGNPTGKTVKGLLERVGGSGAQAYWSNLMTDIQNGINAPGDSPSWEIIGKGIGSFKGAAVGGNLRVVIQQPTAFFRAGAVLPPADLSRGIVKGVTQGNGWKKALKYAPIAMRKNAGGFDISSPYQMSETLFDSRSFVRKLNDALSAPAGMADAVTWGKLWNACEWATKREHRDIAAGSEAFYKQTAKRFAEVIDQTQVVDGVLQRSNIMRSSNAVVKQATSFMGEPIMSMNLMMRAWDQFRYEQNPGKRGKALKTLGRAGTALVVTNVINALAQSVIDAMRDDDEDKKYWERFLAAFTGIDGDEESAWDKAVSAVLEGNVGSNMNPLGQIPFVKDALSLIQGYDVSRTELEILSDLIQAGQTAAQSADGTGTKTRAYAVKGLLSAGAKVFGIPVSNLARDIWGFVRTVTVETDNIPLQYEMEKAIYNITNDGNKGRYYDILFRSLAQDDMDSYQHIRGELMEQMALDGAGIDSAMRSRYKKALEQDADFAMSQTALDLIGIRKKYAAAKEEEEPFGADDLDPAGYQVYSGQRAADYREMVDALERDKVFGKLSDDAKDRVLSAAYSMAEEQALMDASGGQYEVTTKWMRYAADAEKIGIENWEYALFHAAYEMAESTKDRDGKTVEGESKQDHVKEWLKENRSLTERQREFLWGTVYKNDWDSN